MGEKRNVLSGEDTCVRYQEKNTDKNSGVYCFTVSVYSEEPDTDVNLRLQAMIELEKRHEMEGETLLC